MILPRTPSFRLNHSRALVTGAGRGIGLAAAAALAQSGAHVILAARTALEIEAAAAQIRADGGRAEALVLDVTGLGAVRVAVDAQPPFDILVNNDRRYRAFDSWRGVPEAMDPGCIDNPRRGHAIHHDESL